MIVDFHTHIFPPHVRDNRDEYVRRDPTFAEMYADPKAKIATAEDLLASMDEAGVDASVALGFAWQDHDDIVRHNDYLLESAARSNGRIIPFTIINMVHDRAATEIDRCAAGGARGIGELRPDNQEWSLEEMAGEALADAARRHNLILLFHVTEPGNRTYPGRHGCTAEDFVAFAATHPDLTIIGGHLAGDAFRTGNPAPNVYADTAAQPFLYPDEDALPALTAPPTNRLLLGSDFPLITQSRQVAELRRVLPDSNVAAALRKNAATILGLDHE
jgi:predicted TIM-barrel fold metal-dependent hydrolase